MKLHKYIGVLLLVPVLLISGCGKNTQYASYHSEVNALYEKIVSTDAKINNIDPQSDDSVEELFESLKGLETAFRDFSLNEPPKEFKDCKFLSDSAIKYLEMTETKFHEAFDNGYDADSFTEGVLYYDEVIKCVNYMGDVLQKK